MATLTTSYQNVANKWIGTISGSGVAAKDVWLRIYAKYNSQDVTNNKSTVSYKSTLFVEGSGTYFYTGATTTKSLSGTGATTKSGSAVGDYYLGETTLYEITGTITHATDGTATATASASWVSNPWGVSGSTSATFTLPTIPRATTPTLSATTATMGSAITITMNPASTSFKHKLRYRWLSDTTERTTGISIGTGFTAQGNTTATFTIPTALANEIPNSNSGKGTIYCYTYNSSGTHIGTKTVAFTANVPSYTPTISNISLVGNNLRDGAYVQGKSTVTVDTTASSPYGATIKSYSTTLDGKTYTSKKFTSSVLSSGSKSAVVKVTDSRGKTASLTSSAFTVYAYANPTITSFTLARQSDGTTVIATVKGNISAINNKNGKSIKVTLNGVTNTITSSSYTISGTTTFTNVPTDSSFTGVATLADSYTSASKSVVLPTVAVTMDFYKDGNGIAMGKVAEYGDLLDVNWPLRARKIVTVDGLVTFKNHLYHHGHVYMGGNKTAAGENHIKFSNPENSTYPHNVYIYGGSPDSSTAIGIYDSANSRRVLNYIDSEDKLFFGHSNTKFYLNNIILGDFVVEQGESGIWTYKKWNSGACECWGNVSTTPTTVNGNNAITVNLPFAFVGTYNVSISPAKAAMYIDAFGDCATNGNITHTTTNFTMSYKYGFGTAYTVSFNVIVHGSWK